MELPPRLDPLLRVLSASLSHRDPQLQLLRSPAHAGCLDALCDAIEGPAAASLAMEPRRRGLVLLCQLAEAPENRAHFTANPR